MLHLQNLFYFILLHSIMTAPQFNLYYTDWIEQSQNENDNALQHNCLRLVLYCESKGSPCEIISFCMNELPSKFSIENTDHLPQFTFAQLAQQNITAEQLYLWSTPIDIIERYQFYLHELSTSNNLLLKNENFYNCTMPTFGPKCQYQLYSHYSDHSTIYDIVNNFYQTYGYHPTTLTCYTHLKCNRGSQPSCLDWSEICDGKINCINDGVDEEHCWQIEINECNDDEYRCRNGQCIPPAALYRGVDIRNCFDASESGTIEDMTLAFDDGQVLPLFIWEDTTCSFSPLTSSCKQQREDLLIQAMYSSDQNLMSADCWSAFQSMFNLWDGEYLSSEKFYQLNISIEIVINICPDVIYFPNVPVLFGDIYFAYAKNDSQYLNAFATKKSYICYNSSHYDSYFINAATILFNNMKCIDFTQFLSLPSHDISPMKLNYAKSIKKAYKNLLKYHLTINYNPTICNRSNMYQCRNSSKCISIYRLLDAKYDCPYMDDENQTLINNTTEIERIKSKYFKCPITNKYIAQSLQMNGDCNCDFNLYGFCDDENPDALYTKMNITFQRICDGFNDLLPIPIGEMNETDETECEQWECNNLYTSCNDMWNCPNGVDETGCITYSTINCSLNFHYCVSPYNYKPFCLSVEKANDGFIDCLGASDEPTFCRENFQINDIFKVSQFYCINRTSSLCIDFSSLCDGNKQCEHGDDEQFCSANRTKIPFSRCVGRWKTNCSDVENIVFDHQISLKPLSAVYFSFEKSYNLIEKQMKNMKDLDVSSASVTQISDQYQPRCHRGLDLIVWSNNTNKLSSLTCLCPPSYYGDQCQYQNQRISLTIKFQALSDSWQTLFAIVISLIDDTDQRKVHSYEQITYLWAQYCTTRYNMYLVYSTRPKVPTNNYSIHIDIYEKETLKYRGSLIFPVKFPFLPVHRLVHLITIPRSDEKIEECLINPCAHGKCLRYTNNPDNAGFCQCAKGWSGRYCNIEYISKCSSNSTDVGITSNNQSICVCPLHRFGSRCLLTDPVCLNDNNSTCLNDGQCIPSHEFMIPRQSFICICPEGYSGKRCEIVDSKIILSFNKDIVVPQSLFIHFFIVPGSLRPGNATTFKTVPIQQDSITINWAKEFNLVFIEFPINNYYFVVRQRTYKQSTIIKRTINPSDRCPHIRELFNQTFTQLHLIRRIKYYHLACQNQSLNPSCFYDDVHLCLCYTFDQKRLANCIDFVHNTTFNCVGKSECENDAQCFQDEQYCPTRSICMCLPCYYGKRCQFTTSGFGLSLDAILSYHILPNVAIIHQTAIAKFSLALTIILMSLGLVDSILCVMAFKNKTVCQVGCGLYLLCSSITTLLTMIIFALKFLILLLSQMSIISNRLFLEIQCYSIDFLLRVCLNMNQWLNACVAIERTYTVIKGISFDRKKTKQTAKFTIILLLLIIIGTTIHDPVSRHLIDEENDTNEKTNMVYCSLFIWFTNL